jgi:hypothetical protein
MHIVICSSILVLLQKLGMCLDNIRVLVLPLREFLVFASMLHYGLVAVAALISVVFIY